MTLIGYDLSHYQDTINLSALNGIDFLTAKASQGPNFKDPFYPTLYERAKLYKVPFAAYHYMNGDDAIAQATNCAHVVTDKLIPIMLDLERSAPRANLLDAFKVRDVLRSWGYSVDMLYLPHWYWQSLGDPDLSHIDMALISSNYGANRIGPAPVLYNINGGDHGAGWNSYGNIAPSIWQFGSRAQLGGLLVDANAIKDERLLALFHVWEQPSPPPPPPPPPPNQLKERDMLVIKVTDDHSTAPCRLVFNGRIVSISNQDFIYWVTQGLPQIAYTNAQVLQFCATFDITAA